jgi:hypothetical protein
MPDLVLVPTAIVPGDGAQYANGIAGVAISAGEVCCLNTTTQRFVLASSGTVATARVRGIAAHSAAVGQPLRIQNGGLLNVGGPLLTVGEFYCLSGLTPGKIGPYSDVTAGDVVTILGVGQTTSLLQMRLWLTEITKAA